MNANQLQIYLQHNLQNNLTPPLIVGKPGIGKSDIVAQTANKLDYKIIFEFPVTSDPMDAKGFPVKNGDNFAKFIPFEVAHQLINATEPTILFLDDFLHGAPAVQASYMQWLLARKIGNTPISEHVRFVLATNDSRHGAATSSALEPLKSRTVIVELKEDLDAWLDWAMHHVHPVFLAFHSFKRGSDPNVFCDFKPTKRVENQPSPRTWHKASNDYIAGLPEELLQEVISGYVGESAAQEFCTFERLWQSLPNLDKLRSNPKNAEIPKKLDILYCIAFALADTTTEENIENTITFLSRLQEEIQVIAMQTMWKKKPKLANTAASSEWIAEKGNLML